VLDFRPCDADNHYYEAEDAFTRHIDPRMAKRAVQWATVDGRKTLLVAGKVNRFIPNPTFDPVARPGCLDDYYQGKNKAGLSIKDAFGALEPIHVEYRDRDARIQVMKRQRMEGALFFPTLGVGMEEALHADPPAVAAAFNAFNEWLHEDWGYAYKNMIFAAPYFSLMDLDNAVAQLERALSRDVRVIVMRPAPVRLPGVSRSLADPYYDRFWARVNEAGITVAMHGGDSGYGRYFGPGQNDDVTAAMLAQLLYKAGHEALSLPIAQASPGELLALIERRQDDVVCISAVPPYAFPPARTMYIIDTLSAPPRSVTPHCPLIQPYGKLRRVIWARVPAREPNRAPSAASRTRTHLVSVTLRKTPVCTIITTQKRDDYGPLKRFPTSLSLYLEETFLLATVRMLDRWSVPNFRALDNARMLVRRARFMSGAASS
jgi:hypothetical protein